jgi:hypothetical protein
VPLALDDASLVDAATVVVTSLDDCELALDEPPLPGRGSSLHAA